MTPGFFSGLVMMFLMRKKRVRICFYEGMVSISSAKQHPRRSNFWNWRFGSFGFGRLLDCLERSKRQQITEQGRPRPAGNSSYVYTNVISILSQNIQHRTHKPPYKNPYTTAYNTPYSKISILLRGIPMSDHLVTGFCKMNVLYLDRSPKSSQVLVFTTFNG